MNFHIRWTMQSAVPAGWRAAVFVQALMQAGFITFIALACRAAKEDLYEVAVLQFIRAEIPEAWQRQHISPAAQGPELAQMILEAYLSEDHFSDRDASCPMIALPSDVSRNNNRVKGAFRQVLEMMVLAFTGNMGRSSRPDRQRALALVSMLVGAMVLARSVDDKALAGELRAAARKEAFAAAGWE